MLLKDLVKLFVSCFSYSHWGLPRFQIFLTTQDLISLRYFRSRLEGAEGPEAQWRHELWRVLPEGSNNGCTTSGDFGPGWVNS